MTTRVELRKVRVVGENPTRFDAPIRLNFVLEVFEQVPSEAIDVSFTWSPVWDFPVDQELDEMEVGPFKVLGRHEFTIESDPPDVTQIPDPTGPTALIISLKYKGVEFLHVGYNVIVTCKGEIPDVFTSASQLSRELGKCFPKLREIRWDTKADFEPTSIEGSRAKDSEEEVPEKRARLEE
ncbi:anti-silencing protein a-like protein [Lotmaria passim]